ncbi:MAG: tetratricopeptide repeat protein [Gammaproteobacteria bacterium]|nr:tetratricopeptide repeat protein [Gammaproteobacteria bacterium]
MIVCLKHGLLTIMLVGISACATLPNGPDEPFTEKPGDIKFGNTTADIMYQILLGEISTQRGKPDVASKFYVSAAKNSNDPRVASRAVRIATFADNKEDALIAAKIWANNEPENQEAKRVLAVLYLRNGNFEQAQTNLANLLSSDSEGIARNLLLTGALLQREASKEGAEQISNYLISLYPKHVEAHYVHASLAMQNQQPDKALISIKKALKLKPDWIEAVMLYPRILQENGKAEESLSYLSNFLRKSPKEDAVRLSYARALVDARKLDQARSQFELLAVKMPNNKDVLFALAMLSMQSKDFQEAEGYLNQLNKQGKANPQVIFYLGQIAEQKKDFDNAINLYSRLRTGEYYIEAQLRVAVILAEHKDIKSALEHLHSIDTKTDEEKREVVLFEGNLLRDFKQYDEAFAFYSDILDSTPKDTEILYFRALVAERLNRIDVVIRDLSYVIEQNPQDAAALNALGYTLADKTGKLEEALKLIQRARDLEPDDAAIIDSLGWINFRLGNIEIAIKYMEEAMEKIDDGEVAAHFGEILWSSGNKEKAISIWKTAREKFGDNEILIKTMERFGQ